MIPNSNVWGIGEESFAGLLAQLKDPDKGESGASDVAIRNLSVSSVEGAAKQMAQDARKRKESELEPTGYHLAVSFFAGDVEGESGGDLFKYVDRLVEQRGLSDHQRVYLLHEDGHHPHVHCVMNLRKLKDQKRTQTKEYKCNLDACRKVMVDVGLSRGADPMRGKIDSWKIQRAKRTGNPPFGIVVENKEKTHFENAGTWTELQYFIGKSNLVIEEKGSGAVVTNGKREAPLSEVRRMWSFPILDDYFPDQFEQVDERSLPNQPLTIRKEGQELLLSKLGRRTEPMYMNYYFPDDPPRGDGIEEMPGRPFAV
jgi:hypothetical protein